MPIAAVFTTVRLKDQAAIMCIEMFITEQPCGCVTDIQQLRRPLEEVFECVWCGATFGIDLLLWFNEVAWPVYVESPLQTIFEVNGRIEVLPN